ncbi:hypothetical protein M758_1G216700 [Ceratodon purpureus]|nr:hypothetical protein M758_1G216700 [Ceratodon purpureus]
MSEAALKRHPRLSLRSHNCVNKQSAVSVLNLCCNLDPLQRAGQRTYPSQQVEIAHRLIALSKTPFQLWNHLFW